MFLPLHHATAMKLSNTKNISIMKDLITVFEMVEKLGFNIDSLTFQEGVNLKREIIELINNHIIESDNAPK